VCFAHRLRRLIRSEISLVWELLGWRSVWPMDLQLYSLIVGLMREARLCSATKASAKSSATPYTGGHFGVFYNRKSFLFILFLHFLIDSAMYITVNMLFINYNITQCLSY